MFEFLKSKQIGSLIPKTIQKNGTKVSLIFKHSF
jgi:hypothetical protein